MTIRNYFIIIALLFGVFILLSCMENNQNGNISSSNQNRPALNSNVMKSNSQSTNKVRTRTLENANESDRNSAHNNSSANKETKPAQSISDKLPAGLEEIANRSLWQCKTDEDERRNEVTECKTEVTRYQSFSGMTPAEKANGIEDKWCVRVEGIVRTYLKNEKRWTDWRDVSNSMHQGGATFFKQNGRWFVEPALFCSFSE